MNDIWVCNSFDKCGLNCYHAKPHGYIESCPYPCDHYDGLESSYCKSMTKLEYEMKKIIKEE